MDKENKIPEQALTLEDYFAAMALQGMLAKFGFYPMMEIKNENDLPLGIAYNVLPNAAYSYARAMIKEKNKATNENDK